MGGDYFVTPMTDELEQRGKDHNDIIIMFHATTSKVPKSVQYITAMSKLFPFR
jgi:hypothetical protein